MLVIPGARHHATSEVGHSRTQFVRLVLAQTLLYAVNDVTDHQMLVRAFDKTKIQGNHHDFIFDSFDF